MPPEPTFIAMMRPPRNASAADASAAARRRFGDEADFRDARPLARVDDPADAIVVRAAVAADLHFGLRRQHGDLLQPLDQRGGVSGSRRSFQ